MVDTVKDLLKGAWPIGHKIKGRYEVRDIKVGGMAIVYLCYDHEFQENFAIKTFQDRYIQEKLVVDKFFLEAESWMRLEKHKNIVWVKWVDKINERPHIFMEYIEGDHQQGSDLGAWIGSRYLTTELSLSFAIQICTGLIYAQRKFKSMKRPFIHRDLKPNNIMITTDGIAKVTDFGLAKVCNQYEGDIGEQGISSNELERKNFSFTKTGSICGTPPYMSPEQWNAVKDVDIRSDIYSFGCMLYEMLTGNVAFYSRDLYELKNQHLNTAPKSLRELNSSVPDDLNALVMRCIEKEPSNRYRNFEELRDELNDVYNNITVESFGYDDDGEELSVADLSNIAMSLQELGNSKESINYYDRIIARIMDEIAPEMVARAFNNRGNCYFSLRDYEKALANYELAKRIDPNYDFPWHNSAGIYIDIDDHKQALAEANQAIKINNGFSDSYARRADIHYHLGNYEEAIEDCNKAITLEPKHLWAYKTRARVYEALGDHRRAESDYETVNKFKG